MPRTAALLLVAWSLALALPATASHSSNHPEIPGLFLLAGSDPDLPQDDLAPLRHVVGNAKVIGLGEAFHTSGGFYEMKHRVFRHLVENEGFRVLAFENPWRWTLAADQYVQTCEGTSLDAAASLFTVFASGETAALFQWMCEWNREHPDDRVRVAGFDTQYQSRDDAQALTAFLGRLGVPADGPIATSLLACDGVTVTYAPRLLLPEAVHRQCEEGLNAVADLFARDEKEIEKQTSKEDFAWARIYLIGLRAWQYQAYYNGRNSFQSQEARDDGMASMFIAQRELLYPNERVALWAHNVHLTRNSSPAYPLRWMGTFLGDRLGDEYAAIALVAAESVLSQSNGTCRSWPYYLFPGTIEQFLYGVVGDHYALLDLDLPGNQTDVLDPDTLYAIGRFPMYPRNHFDAVIYLPYSQPMQPLFWPACQ